MAPHASAWPGDFYHLREALPASDQALLNRLRETLDAEVAPVINDYWIRAEFPHDLLPVFAELGVAGASYKGYGFPDYSAVLDGLVFVELARVDRSCATFLGVHGGLAAGSIYLWGADEQTERWLPAMSRQEKIGAFGLTEPEVGSGRCRRADHNGEARR